MSGPGETSNILQAFDWGKETFTELPENESSQECVGGPIEMIREDGSNIIFDEQQTTDLISSDPALNGVCAVVSIIGPQSSGKSYLLNQIFKTNFEVLNHEIRWGQTTKGLWLSKCIKPSMLVIDVEGCDSGQKQEETSFEKKAALFALIVSDVFIINIKLSMVGLENAGGNALLRTVFQQRMEHLLKQKEQNIELNPVPTIIIFIIRDYKFNIPFNNLKECIKHQMQMMWETATARIGCQGYEFSQYFEDYIIALPDPTYHIQDFNRKVAKLRNWFAESDIAGFEQRRKDVSLFAKDSEFLWEQIENNESLNLPSHWYMVSEWRCMKAFGEIIAHVHQNEDLMSLARGERVCDSVQDFLGALHSFKDLFITEYKNRTTMTNEYNREEQRIRLENDINRWLERPCELVMIRERSQISEESMEMIRQYVVIRRHSDKQIETLVNNRLDVFADRFKELRTSFTELFDENRRQLEGELQARIEIYRLKMNQALWRFLDTVATVFITIGVPSDNCRELVEKTENELRKAEDTMVSVYNGVTRRVQTLRITGQERATAENRGILTHIGIYNPLEIIKARFFAALGIPLAAITIAYKAALLVLIFIIAFPSDLSRTIIIAGLSVLAWKAFGPGRN